jgi:hypothetical protein
MVPMRKPEGGRQQRGAALEPRAALAYILGSGVACAVQAADCPVLGPPGAEPVRAAVALLLLQPPHKQLRALAERTPFHPYQEGGPAPSRRGLLRLRAQRGGWGPEGARGS